MNEDVAKDSIRFAFRTSKVGIKALFRGLRAGYRFIKGRGDKTGKGRQTVKQLVRQGQGVTSMEVSGESMRDFKKTANKYGVDFAIVKDKGVEPPKYTVFFKAKDTDAIEAVLAEYAAKIVRKNKEHERPSILEKLRKFKEEIAKSPRKVVEKLKENVR